MTDRRAFGGTNGSLIWTLRTSVRRAEKRDGRHVTKYTARTNRLFSTLLAVASLGLISAVANDAQASSWKIRIDNWGNPDKPGYWGTDDNISVSVCNPNIFGCRVVGTIYGPTGIANFEIVIDEANIPFSHAKDVKLLITGSNMFVVDQLQVIAPNGNLARTFGADNMTGYCLSSDDADGSDVACTASGAHYLWGFSIEFGSTYHY